MRQQNSRITNVETEVTSRPAPLSLEATEAGPKELSLSGSLDEKPSRALIEELHQIRFTGTLSLSLRDKKKKLWFSRGEIFRIQSNMLPELLGKMMVDRLWLTEADLQTCLKVQKDLFINQKSSRRIGELVGEIHDVDSDEMESLVQQQHLYSFLQALTWNSGLFEAKSIELTQHQEPQFKYSDVIGAVRSLFEIESRSSPSLLDQVDPWHPESKPVELSQTPLWSILAGARRYSLNGIISVRRQNRLYELVVKYGIPFTFYEGTLGQPRQTIVVRQASEEHEVFFMEQIFRLFSFLTGTASFRSIQDQSSRSSGAEAEAHLQFKEEATGVTKSVSADEVPSELRAKLLPTRQFALFVSQGRSFMRRTLRRWRNYLLESLQNLTEKLQRSLAKMNKR